MRAGDRYHRLRVRRRRSEVPFPGDGDSPSGGVSRGDSVKNSCGIWMEKIRFGNTNVAIDDLAQGDRAYFGPGLSPVPRRTRPDNGRVEAGAGHAAAVVAGRRLAPVRGELPCASQSARGAGLWRRASDPWSRKGNPGRNASVMEKSPQAVACAPGEMRDPPMTAFHTMRMPAARCVP